MRARKGWADAGGEDGKKRSDGLSASYSDYIYGMESNEDVRNWRDWPKND